MNNEMARQNFPGNQSEIILGAPATTDEFEITEGRGAKKRAPATIDEFEITEGRGTQLRDPDPQASSPSGNDFEQCFKEKRKGNEQRNGPAIFSENPIRN